MDDSCPICNGSGSRGKTEKAENRLRAGRLSFFRNYLPDGPNRSIIDESELHSLVNTEEMLCGLCGHWMIFQSIKGHRFSTDDVCTAFVAIEEIFRVQKSSFSHLDLGSGLATVLLLIAWTFHEENYKSKGIICTKSFGVEAQLESIAMAARSIDLNGCADRCQVIHDDISELETGRLLGDGVFELITGTPPYFPLTDGAASVDSGRTQCAFECRGGIELYVRVAAAKLARTR